MRLLQQPKSGLDFEQTAEPNAPKIGQVWRERSSAGRILGDWEWSGSLWLSIEPHYSQRLGGNVISAATASGVTDRVLSIPHRPSLITEVRYINGAWNVTETNTLRLSLQGFTSFSDPTNENTTGVQVPLGNVYGLIVKEFPSLVIQNAVDFRISYELGDTFPIFLGTVGLAYRVIR